ncbi:glutamine--fructose-6-phosphate transaminase (isomerizing), partial [Rhizopus stolonifer]
FSVNDDDKNVIIIKQAGKAAALRKLVGSYTLITHSQPSHINSRSQRSDGDNEFTIVHNGAITNCKEIMSLLKKKRARFLRVMQMHGYMINLTKYIYDAHTKDLNLTDLVRAVVKELEGSYVFIFKNKYFSIQLIATRRG